MENNMKQFNLQEYLANPNRPVITREGKKVRIICTDAKSIYPVLGLVDDGICGERFISCQENGRESNDLIESTNDLFFAPIIVKRWGIVYRKAERLFDTREEAEKWREEADEGEKKFCSVCKVEWEEK